MFLVVLKEVLSYYVDASAVCLQWNTHPEIGSLGNGRKALRFEALLRWRLPL